MTFEEFINYDIFSCKWVYKLRYIGYSYNYIKSSNSEVFRHYILSHGKIFVVEIEYIKNKLCNIKTTQLKKYLVHKRYNTSHTYCKNLNYMLNTDGFNYSIEDFYELLIARHTGSVNDKNAAFRVEYFIRKMQSAWTSNYEFVDCINNTLKQVRG